CYCLCLSGSCEGAPMKVSEPTVKRWGNAFSVAVAVIAVVLFLNRKRQSNLISCIRRRYRRALYVKNLLPIGAIWPCGQMGIRQGVSGKYRRSLGVGAKSPKIRGPGRREAAYRHVGSPDKVGC